MRVPAGALEAGGSADEHWIEVPPSGLRATLTELKGQGFESWSFLTCVDHLANPLPNPRPERFELVYQLRNMRDHELIRVRCWLEGDQPEVDSVNDLYAAATWDERETWDLFGVGFRNHPDLRRILLPDEWVGHPLRRDYPVGGEPVEFSEDQQVWHTPPAEA